MSAISIVIPVRNGGESLNACLAAARSLSPPPREILVVDDASTDGSASLAVQFGCKLLTLPASRGPAAARNRGASAATGDWLLFLDADVVPHPDLLARLSQARAAHPHSAAFFGSYDDAPAAPGLVSQFRNLLHHFTHHHADPRASTFWAGCGAIRRDLFLAVGGFDESFSTPSIEDIELGLRLSAAGHAITLDPQLQVCHLKRWTLARMIHTDIARRAWPWARLMLRLRHTPNDLNTRWSQRWSALFAWLTLAALAASPLYPPAALAALLPLALAVTLNLPFFRFLSERRGLLFAALSVPLYLMYLLYSSATFAAALLSAPFASRPVALPERQA
jgi:glycosyltransferase involved in cell wall biosynthesis